MKKSICLFFILILLLSGCANDSYEINITIPAGSSAEYVWSDQEICPQGKTVTILAGENIPDTELVLMGQTATQPTYLTHGMPVELEVERGQWYAIGLAIQNPGQEDLTVTLTAQGVEVRIP